MYFCMNNLSKMYCRTFTKEWRRAPIGSTKTDPDVRGWNEMAHSKFPRKFVIPCEIGEARRRGEHRTYALHSSAHGIYI